MSGPPRRVLLAPNAFKGTFDAIEVAEIWAAALAGSGLEVERLPLSDGGDGFAAVARRYRPASLEVRARARDARGRPVEAAWTWDPDTDTAYVESAAAIGLARLEPALRDPLAAHSGGLAPLLRTAAAVAPREVAIGLGGSATVDGGWGLGRALGFRFETADGSELARPADLVRLVRIRPPAAPAFPPGPEWTALADVPAPLLGPVGAAAAFGPQKGADPAAVERLEAGLERLAARWSADLGAPGDLAARPGAGAAGGLGAGLAAFLGARLESGPVRVAELAGLDAALARVDLVLTGEGRFDAGSRAGKATGHVIERARARGIPVAVVCAGAEPGIEAPGVTVVAAGALDPPLDAAGLAALARRAAGA